MDQGFVATGIQRKILDDRGDAQTVGTDHEAQDDDHKPMKSSLSGKAVTEIEQEGIDCF